MMFQYGSPKLKNGYYFVLIGANACVQLNQFEEAITWCDKGLAVSFTIH